MYTKAKISRKGFTLLDETKTLTDDEIDKTMNRLMKAFEEKLGAVIRK
jgi:phenylalanyl-tRNA synthetase beta chain